MPHNIKILISYWPRMRKFSQLFWNTGGEDLFLSRSRVGHPLRPILTGGFMRKIYARSWILFTLTAKANRVLCQLVMFLTVFFHWMYKNEIQLLSRLFCHSWLVFLLVFWLRDVSLAKGKNPISDGIVFVFHLAWKVWSDTGLTWYLSGAASRMVSLSNYCIWCLFFYI